MVLQVIKKLIKRVLPRSLHPIRFELAVKAQASRRRQAILGPYATAILTEGPSGKFLVAASDMEVGRYLAFEGGYNRREVEFHLDRLNSKSEVLFVGAHVGSLLVPIARRAGRVVGIEANPKTFALLEMNVCLNKLTNVELYHCAAGAENGEIEILMHKHNTGGSLIKLGCVTDADPIWGYDRPEVARVPMRRLDDQLEGEAFDLIVMDVEGAEWLALRGMAGLLSKSQRMQVELSSYMASQVSNATPEDIVQLLRGYFEKVWPVKEALEGAKSLSFEQLLGVLQRAPQSIDVYLEK